MISLPFVYEEEGTKIVLPMMFQSKYPHLSKQINDNCLKVEQFEDWNDHQMFLVAHFKDEQSAIVFHDLYLFENILQWRNMVIYLDSF